MIYVAIMGYGTIGSGVAEILEENKELICKNIGEEIGVKYVLDLREFPGTSIEDKIIHDFSVIEQDEEVRVVVETMGGLNPAYKFVKACLEAGKHVATSNKALVAAHGTELLQIARDKQVNFFFEGSVGGGIPIIRPLYRSLMGEKIEEITGILNGTTNYILTKMDKEGQTFDAALNDAQDLGYAERNPEADVEGHDTCRKIAILTAMATGKEVNYEEIYTEGITNITKMDFRYANELGTSIKLFGSSRVSGGEVHAWVAPMMIDQGHPLYAVNDVYNGIIVKGNMLGTTMYYGSGAGKLPTASAVVADIIDAAKHMTRNVVIGWNAQKQKLADLSESKYCYFIRIQGAYTEVAEHVKNMFGQVRVIQLEGVDEFAILTEEMSEGSYRNLAAEWNALSQSSDRKILQSIRAEFYKE